MKIGILGAGMVAQALGKGFVATGHEVKVSSRSGASEKAEAWVAATGAGATVGTLPEAAGFGELIIVATPGATVADAILAAGPGNLAGKVVIDATNPLDWSTGAPRLAISGNNSAGETIQRLAPDAKVVKTYNTVNAAFMINPKWAGGKPDMYIAGDDPGAKQEVSVILSGFGWNPVDLGGITSARWQEAMAFAWILHAMASKRWNTTFTLVELAA